MVLVVEDSRTQAIRRAGLLQRAGYRVAVASDGVHALDMLATMALPDAVVTDVAMPRMNGLELCAALREDPRLQRLPVLVITTHGESSIAIGAMRAGADSYVLKELPDAIFLQRLAQLFEPTTDHGDRTERFLSYAFEDYREAYRLLRDSQEELALAKMAVERRAGRLESERGELVSMARDAEQTSSALFEAITESVIVTGSGGSIVDINMAAERLLGRPREELIGGDGGRLFGEDGSVTRKGSARRGQDVRFVRPDGAELWIDFTSFATRWGGAPAHLTIARDVTGQHRAEAARARTARLINALGLAKRRFLATEDPRAAGEVVIDFLRKEFRAENVSLWPMPTADGPDVAPASAPDEHPGLAALHTRWRLSVLDRPDRSAALDALLHALENERPLEVSAGVARLAGGDRELPDLRGLDRVLLSGIVLEGRVAGLLAVVAPDGGDGQEATELDAAIAATCQTLRIVLDHERRRRHRESLERQLRRADRMEALGRLAGGIAHDFNNLLTVIGGSAELLREADSAERDQDIAEVVRAVDRGRWLTDQLLAFTRTHPATGEPCRPAEVVSDMARMLRRLLREDIVMRIDAEAESHLTALDAGAVQQIVTNLVVNAMEAMPVGGEVELGVSNVTVRAGPPGRPSGECVQLTVADTGNGIAPQDIEHIFEPFYTTKAEQKGTGLGLATAAGLIGGIGGHIRAENRSSGGARFVGLIPRLARAAVPEPRPKRRTSKTDYLTPAVTILVVDDDSGVRRLTTRVLRGSAATVLSAATPGEALELGGKHRIDLLVTDVVMPEMDGARLYARLKESTPNLRALFMSGYTADVLRPRDLLGSNATLLNKPFAPAELRAAANKMLTPVTEPGRAAAPDLDPRVHGGHGND